MEIKKLRDILKKSFKKNEKVYIIGHNFIDLDALGAALGIAKIAEKYNKKSFIILDDKILEKGVSKVYNNIKNKYNFVKSNDIKDKDLSSSVLVVVDTNKMHLVSVEKFINKFKDVIVIDHHDVDKNTIKTEKSYIEPLVSSACEIVTELLKLFMIKIDSYIATILFSGIVLDTNNFVLKANKKTFYNAYYLLSKGASPIEVQYLLKQDIKKFINRQKMLSDLMIIDDKIAIAKGVKKDIYRREDLAKVAETLLLFDKIESSFAIGMLSKDEVGISGRTLGKKHIGNIMKKLGGGGNNSEGATKIKNMEIKEVVKNLKDIL